jgi:dipeptidyl aminopeptidase/acylaminoacyl peptidase
MHGLRGMGLLALLCVVLPSEILAQSAAGFDPRPVEIPNAQKTTPRPVTSMDLLNLRDFHGSQISPDGKWVAFVLGQAVYDSNSYRSGLFIVSTAKGAKPTSLGSAGPPHWKLENQWWPENPQWSSDSEHIYYRLKNTGTWQVWKWKQSGGAPIQVTHLARNVESFQIIPDGTKLALAVEKPSTVDEKQLVEHGVLYDGTFNAGMPRPLLDEIVLDHTEEGRGGTPETETWIHDLRNGTEREATKDEADAYNLEDYGTPTEKLFSKKELEELAIGRIKISPDGKNVVYEHTLADPSESARMTYPLFLKPVVGGMPIALTPGLYYAVDFWWSPDSKEIYYSEFDAAGVDNPRPTKLMAVSATGGEPRKVLDSPGLQYGYSLDRAGRFLACTHEDNTTPPELELADLSKGQTHLLADANPEFQNLQLSPTKRIDISNKYGDHFWGHLVYPLGYEPGKRYPLILTTYRDGDYFLRGAVGDEYPIQVFAANGFAVLNLDIGEVRNSKRGDFESQVLFWASPIEGMDVAITRLAEMGIVDRSQVAVTGLSHGAELVNYAISQTHLFRAAIASGSGVDPIAYDTTTDFFRSSVADTYSLGWPDGDSRARWQRVSPALNASRVFAPLLINAADDEYVWDMQWVTALRELKKPVEMFIYPNELHLKNQPKHRYEIYQRNLDWMEFWLKGKEDPNPAKAEQYGRWRKLRSLRDADQGHAINSSDGSTASKP